MGNSSADIEALLVNFNDLDDPTPGQLPAIFRDIVGRLSAHGLAYAVLGRIALTRYEQARYVSDIEIVAELGENGTERAAALVQATRERFAPFMDRGVRRNAISLVRPCSDPVEGSLITQGETCDWFGIEARIASAEHLLWLWCRSDTLDYRIDASALIGGGVVDLYRVLQLLREPTTRRRAEPGCGWRSATPCCPPSAPSAGTRRKSANSANRAPFRSGAFAILPTRMAWASRTILASARCL